MFHTPFLPDMTCLVDWALYKCHSLSLHPRPLCPQPMQSCDLCWVDVQTSGFVGLGINTFSGLCVHYFCVPCCVCWYEHSLKSNKPFESVNLSLSLSLSPSDTPLTPGTPGPEIAVTVALKKKWSRFSPAIHTQTQMWKQTAWRSMAAGRIPIKHSFAPDIGKPQFTQADPRLVFHVHVSGLWCPAFCTGHRHRVC